MSSALPTPETLEALGSTRAAALWLERLQEEDTGEDNPALRQWLNASDANRLAWAHALELWDSFDEADDGAFEGMRREALTFRSRRLPPSWTIYSIAASVVLVVSVGVLLNRGGVNGHPQPQVAAALRPDLRSFGQADYTTAVGQRSTVSLSDGSKLTLDTDSAVDIAFANGQRLARLVRGQGFFDVAHDAAHPFRVAAGGRIISVMGTRFNIRLSAEETRVVLVQGSVGVSKGNDPAHPANAIERLSPGQQLIVRAGRPDRIDSVDVDVSVEWKRGFVQFEGGSLAKAVEEMNRYTDKKLVVRDPRVAALRVSGAFPTNDTQRFMAALSTLYPVHAVPMADGRIEIAYRR
jgi:transmembrane sensor